MKLSYYLIIPLLVSLHYSCTPLDKEILADPSAPAPAQISGIEVEETHGGAVIRYKLPIDPNLLYVKAEYEIQPGVFREAKSSAFLDTLALVGFGDTDIHQVKLYSVGKNEKYSEPVLLNIQPLLPPHKIVFESLEFKETFGGVNVKYTNDLKANLALVVLVDSTGNNDWAPASTFYTAALAGNFSARGFEAEEKRFAVFIRDRWNNKSDTLIKPLKPLFEELLTKDRMSAIKLQSDAPSLPQYAHSMIIDDIFNNAENIFASANDAGVPQSISLNLGRKVSISRFKLYHRAGPTRVYASNSPKKFEVYGSNTLEDDWDTWTLLGTFDSFKPSGLPFGQVSADDLQYAAVDGEDFEFLDPVPPIQFLRIKFLENYGNATQIVFSELTFWGQNIE